MQRTVLKLGLIVFALALCPAIARANGVRFCVTSDSRGESGHSLALAAVNDVAGGPGDFIITTGDMDPLTTTEAQIDSAFGSGFTWYPVIGNHEQEDPIDVTYLRDFYWDKKKPLYIGEYLWVPQQDYSAGTIFFGDDAYLDREAYHNKAKLQAWIYQTIAYRRAGVSSICPLSCFRHGVIVDELSRPFYEAQKELFRPVVAYLQNNICGDLLQYIVTRRCHLQTRDRLIRNTGSMKEKK